MHEFNQLLHKYMKNQKLSNSVTAFTVQLAQ